MATPGTTLSTEVIDLLADPRGHDPARQGALELCEMTEQVAVLRRAVEIAQLRQLAEMVDRETSTKAVGIIAAWLHAHSELLLRDVRRRLKPHTLTHSHSCDPRQQRPDGAHPRRN